MKGKYSKTERILGLYSELIDGRIVNKSMETQGYGVDKRSIQRDMCDIRNFLEQRTRCSFYSDRLVYDKRQNGYYLERENKQKLFKSSEILAICKILLESRAFTRDEMKSIIDRLIKCCTKKESQKVISELIGNEVFHYVELTHRVMFLDTMWEIAKAIKDNNYVEIDYLKMKDKTIVKRRIIPLSIMFSEYYFYIVAFIDNGAIPKKFDLINEASPTIYRLDRIKKLKILEEKFFVPYSNRFEEGEFRKRIQFMYGGELQKVKFEYYGESIEAVLDRFPTAKILEQKEGKYVISVEVFGKGIDMWLRSQGKVVSVLE